MRRILYATLLCLVGIAIGAVSVHLYTLRSQLPPEQGIKESRDNEIRDRNTQFERRVQCWDLAAKYAKAQAIETWSAFVNHVDFSPTRNSCIASIAIATTPIWRYEVVDLLTAEGLFSDSCSERKDTPVIYCGDGNNSKIFADAREVFEKHMGSS